MDETESQIAKIQLGNNRASQTYVFVMAEKAQNSDDELYVVAELPVFNPAAEESCERICLAIASTLKRAYRHNGGESSFENAISQINEELGKLASMGQTQWIDRLSCILGVRRGNNFDIATCGKVAAYLLRNGEFTDISCSTSKSHPLKTFENYASGKIRLHDLLLLSTSQLFNYLSMDRVLEILGSADFLTATRTIIELLKQAAEPQVSFGVLLNLQVPMGQASEEEPSLEDYMVNAAPSGPGVAAKTFDYLKGVLTIDKSKRRPQTGLPQVSLSTRIKNIAGGAKVFAKKSIGWWNTAKTSAQTVRQNVNREKFKSLSTQKKFFLVSAAVLLIALIANIVLASHLNKIHRADAAVLSQLNNAQQLLNNAESSLLYKDDTSAGAYMIQAKAALPAASKVSSANKTLYQKLLAQYSSQEQQMERIVQVQVTNLGSLGQGGTLINLPNYVAEAAGPALVSYNKTSAQIQDNQLSTGSTSIVDSSFVSGNLDAIYDGASLYVWDFSASKLTAGFSTDVPAKNAFGGMAYYPTNSRVYVLDTANSRIMNFLVSKTGLSRPIISVNDSTLSQGLDMAIDGNIYVLTKTGITKFTAGKLADFNLPVLSTPYSGTGKIYTEKGFNYVYLLDAGNNRILVMDQTGNLIYTLESSQFTKLTDFAVDEAAKTVYVLNDGSLLKVALP